MKRVNTLAILLCCATTLVAQPERVKEITSYRTQVDEHGVVTTGSVFPDLGLTDPHSWVENGTVYVVCGHDQSWRTTDTWRMDRWEIWSSKDLIHWTHVRDIEPTETYIGDQPNCWAGDICERDGKYYWFFSNGHHDAGVMVADNIEGPYTDMLGKPLLTPDMIGGGKAYDPEIFIEDGKYTVSFSAGTYYLATLAEDMKSLTTKPQPIVVTKDGKKVGCNDKSTLFKHNDWYYLLYGSNYAMSRNLYGPYELQDNYLTGGHNSIIEWKGQHYLFHEFSESYLFYRGVGMTPLYFNEDGTLRINRLPSAMPGASRYYHFTYSQMGWCEESGTTVQWHKDGYIYGDIEAKGAIISSIPYVGSKVESTKTISFELTNNTRSKRARVYIATYDAGKMFWTKDNTIDWDNCPYLDIKIKANAKQQVVVELDKITGLDKAQIQQIRIEPAADAKKGNWAIDELIIK